MFYSIHDNIDLEQITQLISRLGNLLYANKLITDSRKVTSSDIFVAYKGVYNDGRDYISKVIPFSPACIIYESYDNYHCDYINSYAIYNLSSHLGFIASYKYPCRSTTSLIGVTGTNGKTSITNWLNQLYYQQNITSGVIGTIGSGIYPEIIDHASTTPDPILLNQLIHGMSQTAEIIAMEVSSHALDQGRVNGLEYKVAIFTNLTQDHLDYHGNMENYYQAKKKLFLWNSLQVAIINIDDSYGKRLYEELKQERPSLQVISYALSDHLADVCPLSYDCTSYGVTFKINYDGTVIDLQANLFGKFNLYNLLAIIAYMKYIGVDVDLLQNIIPRLKSVTGRVDEIMLEGKPLVVIDYAHTPDALDNILQTLHDIKKDGRLICVFGCGGDRDRLKRPLMGKIASSIADVVIVTSDNPRHEEPSAIIQDICAGFTDNNYQVVLDRHNAIELALETANSDDIVLIAGKGHETYQDVGGVKHYFSDKETAYSILKGIK